MEMIKTRGRGKETNNKARQAMGHVSESRRWSRNLQSDGDRGGACRMTKRELDKSGGELESEGRVRVTMK